MYKLRDSWMEAGMPAPTKYDPDAPKRATVVSLDESLLGEARALQTNVSKAAERGLAQAVMEKRAELWLLENKAALDCSNDYVVKQGLPLARYRRF
jgi:antitoxin CcdA